MAKFPTEVERTTTLPVSLAQAYAFFWDVVGSSRCIPGVDRCEPAGADTYRFIFQERSTGPLSMIVRYTARYTGNGSDEIRFQGISAADDNTDVDGMIHLAASSPNETRVTIRQTIAPDTPVPRLLQGLVKSFVQKEAETAVAQYLDAVTRAV
jgi:carbon monoxide dehydrogenase subunit G